MFFQSRLLLGRRTAGTPDRSYHRLNTEIGYPGYLKSRRLRVNKLLIRMSFEGSLSDERELGSNAYSPGQAAPIGSKLDAVLKPGLSGSAEHV